MNSDDYNFDELFDDMTDEKRLGFYEEFPLDLDPDFEDVVEMLNKLSEAKTIYIDADDYEWRITAKVIDEQKRRVAWVEWRYKEGVGEREYHNYYLKARDESGKLIKWEIETYNPYFGCDTEFLEWMDDDLIFIYREKHDTFAVRINKDERERIEISHNWKIVDNVLIYGNDPKKLRLPDLKSVE